MLVEHHNAVNLENDGWEIYDPAEDSKITSAVLHIFFMVFSIVNCGISIAEKVNWACLVGGNDKENEAQNHEGNES
jgi:hypothetical protein